MINLQRAESTRTYDSLCIGFFLLGFDYSFSEFQWKHQTWTEIRRDSTPSRDVERERSRIEMPALAALSTCATSGLQESGWVVWPVPPDPNTMIFAHRGRLAFTILGDSTPLTIINNIQYKHTTTSSV